MSNVSKLVIKACSDNKFSSFTGEFITSINPEDLSIDNEIVYGELDIVPTSSSSSSLRKYLGSRPRILSFSLLLDNTGIMPGSNTIPVMDQIKQLEKVVYSTDNHAPNYLRIIWGQVDFKGSLRKLYKHYTMFQGDGTILRVQVDISVLEEVFALGKGKSAAGVDSKYAKASGANVTSKQMAPSSQMPASKESFAPTPDGMNGPYSGAPPGAYDGSPDQIYHGSNDAGAPVYASSTVANTSTSKSATTNAATGPLSSHPAATTEASSPYGSGANLEHSATGSQGGVAGNGPGGSGGGVGGGGHRPASNPNKPVTTSPSSGQTSGPAGSPKTNTAIGSGSGVAKAGDSTSKMNKVVAASSGIAGGAAMVATVAGANSLRNLKDKAAGLNFLRRLKNFAKKVAPRAYDAGKKAVKSSGF